MPCSCPCLPGPVGLGSIQWGHSPSLCFSLLLAVVFPQDLLEKGLDADNFAMLGLGDIVIPGEDRRGGTGLGSPLRGLRGAEQVPCSALGQAQPCASLPMGWESPDGLGVSPQVRVLSRCRVPREGTVTPGTAPAPERRGSCPASLSLPCPSRLSLSLSCSSDPSLSLLCHFQPLIVSFSLQGSSLPCCCGLISGEQAAGKSLQQVGSCSIFELLL